MYSSSPYPYDYAISPPSSAVSPFSILLRADSERSLPFAGSGSSDIESTALFASSHRPGDDITRCVSGIHFGIFHDTVRHYEKRHYL